MPNKKSLALRTKIELVEEVAHAELLLATVASRFMVFVDLDRKTKLLRWCAARFTDRSVRKIRAHGESPSQCLTGDVLSSCVAIAARNWYFHETISEAPSGILLYLPQEGRGIGLMNKLRAYELQDQGMDTVEANESLGFLADARDYDFPAQILKKLGATKIRLLSNNPEKVRQLKSRHPCCGTCPCQPRISKISRAYLQTKKKKMGHLLRGVLAAVLFLCAEFRCSPFLNVAAGLSRSLSLFL